VRGLNVSQADAVTVRMLLCHTAGFPDDFGTERLPTDESEFVTRLAEMPMIFTPGLGYSYSCIGYVLAGIIAQQITGIDLATLVKEKLLTPLALQDTGYRPSARLQARCAATEDQSYLDRGMVRGVVHDELSWALGGVSGNAGIFGTPADVACLGEAIRQGGSLRDKRIVSERALAQMTREQVPASVASVPYRQGIGFRLDDPNLGPTMAGSGSIGHTGFTGTSLVIGREHRIVLIFLSNRVHPNRRWADLTGIRRTLGDYAADLAREST
jgi:CubicO group peptidase (beta-lactamase class C family)